MRKPKDRSQKVLSMIKVFLIVSILFLNMLGAQNNPDNDFYTNLVDAFRYLAKSESLYFEGKTVKAAKESGMATSIFNKIFKKNAIIEPNSKCKFIREHAVYESQELFKYSCDSSDKDHTIVIDEFEGKGTNYFANNCNLTFEFEKDSITPEQLELIEEYPYDSYIDTSLIVTFNQGISINKKNTYEKELYCAIKVFAKPKNLKPYRVVSEEIETEKINIKEKVEKEKMDDLSEYKGMFRWEDAKNKCASFGMRLPLRNELLKIKSSKKLEKSMYWTSEELSQDEAYYVDLEDGEAKGYDKKSSLNVKCIK
jgi:hypothetical protein